MGTSQSAEPRPLIGASIDELEQLFERSKNLPEVLRRLRHELQYRGRPRARALRDAVEMLLRLSTASSPPAPAASLSATPMAAPAPAVALAHTPQSPSQSPGTKAVGEDRAHVDDGDQRQVIEADPAARMIVNAPPGTGKTTVACARIAWLLDQGVAPHRIWLVSFTRTAVRELRDRISRMAEGDALVHGVRVTTLDSRAWSLVQGFTGRGAEVLAGGHAATIADAITVIRSGDESVEEMLDQMAHLIVDEAQDLLGDRATLLEEIIARIPASCGVTVLTDDAQAIYGFTEDESVVDGGRTLPDRLRARSDSRFEERELVTVHRTSAVTLTRLFVETRRRLLDAMRRRRQDCVAMMRVSVSESAMGAARHVREEPPGPDSLVLFRTRFEVLEASSYLGSAGRPHRIRMSGMPATAHPWVALALAEPVGNRLTRARLLDRWPRVTAALGEHAPDPDAAWKTLHRLAGDGTVVLIDELRDLVSRPRPPIELATGELGLVGPVLSTIHASKGREADDVRLMLPPESLTAMPEDHEEARVLFVGATRARRTLLVGEGSDRRTQRVERTGRRFTRVRPSGVQRWRAQVEFGLEGDVDPLSPVSLALHPSVSGASAAQEWLARQAGGGCHVRAWCGDANDNYAFTLRSGADQESPPIARLSQYLNYDLFSVAGALWPDERLKPPHWCGPLLLLGVRTVAMPVGAPGESEIHGPWRQSGFWLAPIVVGLPTIPFRQRHARG